MTKLIGTLFFIALVFFIYNDQTNKPIVTEAMKTHAEDVYYTVHPNAKSLPKEPFTTDVCTLFPDSFFGEINWKEACIEHDIIYWGGGSKALKQEADKKLQEDVNKIFPRLGDFMYFVTKVTGTPSLPLSWRWGYGWPVGRGYTP